MCAAAATATGGITHTTSAKNRPPVRAHSTANSSTAWFTTGAATAVTRRHVDTANITDHGHAAWIKGGVHDATLVHRRK